MLLKFNFIQIFEIKYFVLLFFENYYDPITNPLKAYLVFLCFHYVIKEIRSKFESEIKFYGLDYHMLILLNFIQHLISCSRPIYLIYLYSIIIVEN